MVSTRAKLLAAAAIAGGVVGSLAAQSPSGSVFAAQSFEVLPPRRLPMPQPSSIYDSGNIPVGFFTTSHRQPVSAPATARVPSTNPNSWLSAPRPVSNAPTAPPRTANPPGVTVMPLFGKPQIPGQPLMPNTPPHAPAWRWHGYGSTGSATTQFAVPSPPTSAANTGLNHPDVGSTVLPMPAPVPMPMPTGPVLQNDPRPTSLPSYTPPSSGPIHAVPLPMGSLEPSWKPMDSRSGFFRNPPPLHDAGVTTAHVATTLPADPWIVSRAVFKPSPEPVAATPPEQPPQATTSDEPLVVLRSTIETVIAGRGRDLEMFHRGPNNLLIRWTVRAAVDAEQLANLISKLPEIAPYHVTYEIAVAP